MISKTPMSNSSSSSSPPSSSSSSPSSATPAAAPLLRAHLSGALRGVCAVPGDKSISHRALLFAALSDGPVAISGLGRGGDNLSTARALAALGVSVDVDAAGAEARVGGVGFGGLRAAATRSIAATRARPSVCSPVFWLAVPSRASSRAMPR